MKPSLSPRLIMPLMPVQPVKVISRVNSNQAETDAQLAFDADISQLFG
jgi:hypothetical protein